MTSDFPLTNLRLKAEQTECPYCKAQPGQKCRFVVAAAGEIEHVFHSSRYGLAKRLMEQQGESST